jgi:hypothetical protein
MAKGKDRLTIVVFDTLEFHVETWWDSTSQNWICQIKSEDGEQIGNAYFSYTRPDYLHEAYASVDAVKAQIENFHWHPKS